MGREQAIDAVIGRNVRMLRAYHAMTQTDLAEKMRPQHPTWVFQTVGSVEKGVRPVLVSEAQNLAVVLGVPLERLLTATV